jgi:hypothetical protein
VSEIHRDYLPAIIKAAGEISHGLGAGIHPNGQSSGLAPARGPASGTSLTNWESTVHG